MAFPPRWSLWKVVAWLIFFCKGEAGSLPPPPPGGTVAAAVLTGLLAFLLGWLAALEDRLRTDQPEERGNRKGPCHH